MPEQKKERPRLITLLIGMLLLQAPFLLFLGLNLVTDHWTFLFSWPVFLAELERAFSLVLSTPGKLVEDAILFYNVLAFAILAVAAAASLFSGLTFNRGGTLTWIVGLFAQIATLLTSIGLYLIYKPSQAYWLMAIGILLVLYLNNVDVRQWFLQAEEFSEGGKHV